MNVGKESRKSMRVIMVAGKGGVGKTTVAAATGVAAAQRGLRTLVMSFDIAHSLADSFDLEASLFEGGGDPIEVAPNLSIQEIDVQTELARGWEDLFRIGAAMMVGGGLDQALAEEVAIIPGMEDIVALLRLNEHIKAGTFDVVVLDAPPTGEALRFVSITSSIDWYVRKRLNIDRKISTMLRPMRPLLGEAGLMLPDDNLFQSLIRLFEGLEGIDNLLRDPKVTTVRLVTNPEKMVVRETQRAFTYFCMYGMVIDRVVINRLMPLDDPFFGKWARAQAKMSKKIEEYFDPVPVSALPMFPNEVVGLRQLEAFSEKLFDGSDPVSIGMKSPAFGVHKNGDKGYEIRIRLPFVPKDKIDISRNREDLVVSVGMFRRNILLPRKFATLQTSSASFEGDNLVIKFKEGEANV